MEYNSEFLKKLDSYSLDDKQLIGNKAFNLLRLQMEGANIPKTWVVSTRLFEEVPYIMAFYDDGISIDDFEKIRKYIDSEGFIRLLGSMLINEISKMISENKKSFYAIRSSSNLEDDKRYSFAGMFSTVLNVRHIRNIIDSVYVVLKDSFSGDVEEMCRLNGIERVKLPAVIIQEFIYSETGGVSFRQDGVVSSSIALGLTKGIVDGISSTDSLVLNDKNELTSEDVTEKKYCVLPVNGRSDPLPEEEYAYRYKSQTVRFKCIENRIEEGIIKAEIPEDLKNERLLEISEAKVVTDTVNTIADKLGIRDYDSEWCIYKGCLYLLQIREITKKMESMEAASLNGVMPIVSGNAVGRTCVIRKEEDLKLFKKGDILVTDIINGKAIHAVMDAAGCIIQTSSPLSHSAIIARELGLPCVGVSDIGKIDNLKLMEIDGTLGKISEVDGDHSYETEKYDESESFDILKNSEKWKEYIIASPEEWAY